MITLQHGDCLKLMKDIPDESIDMILCDLPYGTTACKWDKKIDLVQLWQHYKRIIKDNGAIVLFSQLPFGCELIADATVPFRYEWIWQKTNAMGFMNAHKMPMRSHENLLVFYNHLPTYNPQMRDRENNYYKIGQQKPDNHFEKWGEKNIYGVDGSNGCDDHYVETGKRYPIDIVKFSNWNGGGCFGNNDKKTKHPTQKPVPLLEYLIKTYTNPGETVLDNTMGSGSTGVACINTGRNFIGMELDDAFFDIASDRINGTINNG